MSGTPPPPHSLGRPEGAVVGILDCLETPDIIPPSYSALPEVSQILKCTDFPPIVLIVSNLSKPVGEYS